MTEIHWTGTSFPSPWDPRSILDEQERKEGGRENKSAAGWISLNRAKLFSRMTWIIEQRSSYLWSGSVSNIDNTVSKSVWVIPFIVTSAAYDFPDIRIYKETVCRLSTEPVEKSWNDSIISLLLADRIKLSPAKSPDDPKWESRNRETGECRQTRHRGRWKGKPILPTFSPPSIISTRVFSKLPRRILNPGIGLSNVIFPPGSPVDSACHGKRCERRKWMIYDKNGNEVRRCSARSTTTTPPPLTLEESKSLSISFLYRATFLLSSSVLLSSQFTRKSGKEER